MVDLNAQTANSSERNCMLEYINCIFILCYKKMSIVCTSIFILCNFFVIGFLSSVTFPVMLNRLVYTTK